MPTFSCPQGALKAQGRPPRPPAPAWACIPRKKMNGGGGKKNLPAQRASKKEASER